MAEQNVVSVSGGKDSTALLLLAIESGAENLTAVFADTGNEHSQTYDYVAYLESTVGVQIQRVKADFTRQIAGKRLFVETNWREQGVDELLIRRALSVLQPTGNPFLDLCVWKGRFPSSQAAFCSEQLKRLPITVQVQDPLLAMGDDVVSWQGVRADESARRALLTMREHKSTHACGAELWNYRPILNWDVEQVFAMHRKHGVKPNPLYAQGMTRVGCMPCINCRKDELLEISQRFPEEIDRIREWEQIVGQASKRGSGTFFTSDIRGHGIDELIDWSQTSRGGKQYDFMRQWDSPSCTSIYGLCE
ncbi:phosphoadenosine phosphosulfate reductase family protein [Pseudomonas fragariae (ex Marin et al. 2024)]|uniref:phosphoadenosine phosphosulfate reductase family protein n=1 Tax=Pseudomonas fragariae (ex Marin et al. 2024) TaxID=3080056 RepID=UPI002A24C28D|nr:phosphoadenosine phosphosulfate reductase family protein [Pseudomonas sp. 20]MDX9625932.1 phosphoadenosine phosphosulfate reductase family protein [Pseudomonas sp. 20]